MAVSMTTLSLLYGKADVSWAYHGDVMLNLFNEGGVLRKLFTVPGRASRVRHLII